MTPNVPNLDCMDTQELIEFVTRHAYGANNATLGVSPYVTDLLSRYAALSCVARQARGEGDIQNAIAYESKMDSVYGRLPETAKW